MKYILLIAISFISSTISGQLKSLEPGVMHWSDLPVRVSTERESRSIFEGTSPHLAYLEIHATTQAVGAKPRPPHANKDIEELVIIKEGKVKITIGEQSAILGAGGVAIILPEEMQTFENVGDTPLTYYIFRYRSKSPMNPERGKSNGGSLILNQDSVEFKTSPKGGSRSYFDRPTSMFENFEMHITQLNKIGLSHTPHTHIDTEIILVIEGSSKVKINETDYEGAPGDLFFINSNLIHAAGNGSENPCTYFAFKWR
jgi:(S)-ureidoglycine aminohydrolase